MARLQHFWKSIDLDGSDTLDVDELAQFFALMGKNISEKRVTRTFAEMNGSESGEIEYDEFLARFCHHARNCDTFQGRAKRAGGR